MQPDQPEIVQIQTGNGKVKKYYVDADGAASKDRVLCKLLWKGR